MKEVATPTGDVYKDMDVDKEEYLFFLLKNGLNNTKVRIPLPQRSRQGLAPL